MLKKQKEDYEKCLQSVTQLTHQLDSAMLVRYPDVFTSVSFFVACWRNS